MASPAETRVADVTALMSDAFNWDDRAKSRVAISKLGDLLIAALVELNELKKQPDWTTLPIIK